MLAGAYPPRREIMKRKIVFVAIVMALLACLFAISAYATEIPEWTAITEISGMPDKSVFGDDGKAGATSRVLMSDGVTYPAYYICKNSTSVGFSYSDLNSKTGKSYAAKDVIRLEIPKGAISTPQAVLKTENGYTALLTVSFPEGFTTLGSYTFKGTTSIPSSLMYVTLPSTLTSIEQYAFTYCNSLKELIIPEGITSIPKEMASYTSSLERVVFPSTLVSIGELSFRTSNLSGGVVIPEGCTTISSYAFKGAGVTSVTLPSTLETVGQDIFYDCISITTVNSKSPIIGYRMFYNCDSLTSITLENTVEIREQGFCNPDNGILNITELVLPEGLTSIGNYAFARSKLTSIVLPSTLTTMGQNIFYGSTTLQKIVALNSGFGQSMFMNCSSVNELVLTENFTSFGKDALSSVSQTSFITYYTGTDYDRIKTVCANTTRLSQAKYYSYEDYLDENYTYNKFMVIYDANLCDVVYDGAHAEDGNPCVVNCDRCGTRGAAQANPVHNESVIIEYKNGYHNAGEKITGCTNEGCAHNVKAEFPAIFFAKGYSTNPEKNAINGGYTVALDTLKLYEELMGEIKYGVVIANAEKFDGKSFFDENNKVNTTKALQVEIDSEYCNFDCSINFGSASNTSLKLVICAYVIDDSGVTFIQSASGDNVTIGDNTFKSVTLASVVALVPAVSKEF